MVPPLDMDSLGPCRRLRAGRVLLHDNSGCACVRAIFTLSAMIFYSPLVLPTCLLTHAHANELYHMAPVRLLYRFATFSSHSASLLFLILILFLLASLVHSSDHQVYFIDHFYCSFIFFFLCISRFMSTIHSPHFFLFYAPALFFSESS
jgi:hypothetical protein